MGPKSLYLANPLVFNAPDERRKGFPGTISVKLSRDGQGTKWRRKIDKNFSRPTRVHERYRRQTTDRRHTTDDGRRHIANVNVSSRSLKWTGACFFDSCCRRCGSTSIIRRRIATSKDDYIRRHNDVTQKKSTKEKPHDDPKKRRRSAVHVTSPWSEWSRISYRAITHHYHHFYLFIKKTIS